MPRRLGLLLVAASIVAAPAWAQAPGASAIPDGAALPDGVEWAPLDATLEVVATGFGIPWAVEVLGEDEYLVADRYGSLVHVRPAI